MDAWRPERTTGLLDPWPPGWSFSNASRPGKGHKVMTESSTGGSCHIQMESICSLQAATVQALWQVEGGGGCEAGARAML